MSPGAQDGPAFTFSAATSCIPGNTRARVFTKCEVKEA